jgi:flagellar motor switch protein FliN/FliY
MTVHSPAAFSRFGDVAVRLSVELGRTEMPLRDVLMLGEGSTVTLDRLTDELLDVTANGRVIARGEVVAEKGRFALRIVCLVGEDGKDVPPVADPSFPAVPVADSAPAPASTPAPAAAAPEPEPTPPPPVDPLTSLLDDLT